MARWSRALGGGGRRILILAHARVATRPVVTLISATRLLVDGIASKTVLTLVGKLDMGMSQGIGPAGDGLQAVVAELELG